MPDTPRSLVIAALALAGLLFSWTPVAERVDLVVLDAQSVFLRNFHVLPAPDDIIVIGIDDTTMRSITQPLGLWHEPLGQLLTKVAATRPKAIGLDVILPDRSHDATKPGLDMALMAGLDAAKKAGPFATVLTVDSTTRQPRPIYKYFLAILEKERLSLGLFGRDDDGVVRHFQLAIPIEDGTFPTFVGRLCEAMRQKCRDGLIDFALGKPLRYVPFHEVLAMQDEQTLKRLFEGRIVLIGETRRYTDRINVPVNLAGWETGGRSSPGVVVHAQALRTAIHGNPAQSIGKPLLFLLVTLVGLVVLVRDWRLCLVAMLLAAALLVVASTVALRSGIVLPVAAPFFTLALAWAARTLHEVWKERRHKERLRAGFAGYVSPPVLRGILRGEIKPGGEGERRSLGILFADLRGSTALTAATTPEKAMRLLNRFHEVVASAVHRHDGMLDNIRGDGVMAVFGAPKAVAEPAKATWDAAVELFKGLDRLNVTLAAEGEPLLTAVAGLSCGEAVVGHVGSKDRFNYTAIGDPANLAARLQDEAKRRGYRVVVSGALRQFVPDAAMEPLGTIPIDGLGTVEAWGWR